MCGRRTAGHWAAAKRAVAGTTVLVDPWLESPSLPFPFHTANSRIPFSILSDRPSTIDHLDSITLFTCPSRDAGQPGPQAENRERGDRKIPRDLLSKGIIFDMSEEPERGTKEQLAYAVARGRSVRSWARSANVPCVTAQRWSKDPEVRKMAEELRRRALDGAVGHVAMRSIWVMKRMTRLATEADSDAVQLQALRGLLAEMITVSKYSGLEARMTKLEESRDAQPGNAGRAV